MTRRETAYGVGGGLLGFDLGSVSDVTKAHAGVFYHQAGHEFGQTFAPGQNGGDAFGHLGAGLVDTVKGTGVYLESPQGAIAGAAVLVLGALTLLARRQRNASSAPAHH